MTLVNTDTGEIIEPLTAVERSTLTHAEAKIERGLSSFIEVGEALAEVRDSRLYREEYGTFEAYCRERWGITDRRARQMIDATITVSSLPTGTIVPTSEGQARELSGLDPETAADVMQRANDATNGNVTAAAIRAARTPDPAPSEGEAEDREDDEPEGEATSLPPTPPAPIVDPAPVAPVIGIDGKTYARPTPKADPKPAPVTDKAAADYDNATKASLALSRAISKLLQFQYPNMRDGMRDYWTKASIEVPPAQRADVTPEQMRVAAHGLLALADEWNRS